VEAETSLKRERSWSGDTGEEQEVCRGATEEGRTEREEEIEGGLSIGLAGAIASCKIGTAGEFDAVVFSVRWGVRG
jgi:hypothetical protein